MHTVLKFYIKICDLPEQDHVGCSLKSPGEWGRQNDQVSLTCAQQVGLCCHLECPPARLANKRHP